MAPQIKVFDNLSEFNPWNLHGLRVKRLSQVVVVQTFKPSTQETEADLWVPEQPVMLQKNCLKEAKDQTPSHSKWTNTQN